MSADERRLEALDSHPEPEIGDDAGDQLTAEGPQSTAEPEALEATAQVETGDLDDVVQTSAHTESPASPARAIDVLSVGEQLRTMSADAVPLVRAIFGDGCVTWQLEAALRRLTTATGAKDLAGIGREAAAIGQELQALLPVLDVLDPNEYRRWRTEGGSTFALILAVAGEIQEAGS